MNTLKKDRWCVHIPGAIFMTAILGDFCHFSAKKLAFFLNTIGVIQFSIN
jgi:hypothetical protein